MQRFFNATILCYSTPAPKIPLKDLASMSQGSSGRPVIQSPTVSTVTHPPPVSAVSGSTTTTVTTPTKAEIQPLTDIFVELDKIQPGKSQATATKLNPNIYLRNKETKQTKI